MTAVILTFYYTITCKKTLTAYISLYGCIVIFFLFIHMFLDNPSTLVIIIDALPLPKPYPRTRLLRDSKLET